MHLEKNQNWSKNVQNWFLKWPDRSKRCPKLAKQIQNQENSPSQSLISATSDPVGTIVPTTLVGTPDTTIDAGITVPVRLVGTAVPTIIVLPAYYWKSFNLT